MKALDFHHMVIKLQERFPGIIVKDSCDFYSEKTDAFRSIWIQNASSIPFTKKDTNTISSLDTGVYNYKDYDFEVYKKFDAWCQRRGWYASTESYTMQLFKL